MSNELVLNNVPDIMPAKAVRSERRVRANDGRKLLFLAYHFPPAAAIACVRTWNIAKRLSRLGWHVTVMTPEPGVWSNVGNPRRVEEEARHEGIDRILTQHRWRQMAPDLLNCSSNILGRAFGGVLRITGRRFGIDRAFGWTKPAEQALLSAQWKSFELVLASGPPFVSFKLAQRISTKFHCPYVLDYRDPWTGNPHIRLSPKSTTNEEARLLAGSAAVTVVSPSWGAALDQRFNVGDKLSIVPNGYDDEELTGVRAFPFGHFAIVYAGNFYPPKRVVTPIMGALEILKKETPDGDCYFHYYGGQQVHVREEAKRFNVLDRIIFHGNVPRAEALSAVKGANVAVVITSVEDNNNLEDKGIVTGKVFEMLGLGVRFLLIAPPDSDAGAVAATSALGRCFRGSDAGGIAKFLKEAMINVSAELSPPPNYSWTNIARDLDAILLGVLREKGLERNNLSLGTGDT